MRAASDSNALSRREAAGSVLCDCSTCWMWSRTRTATGTGVREYGRTGLGDSDSPASPQRHGIILANCPLSCPGAQASLAARRCTARCTVRVSSSVRATQTCRGLGSCEDCTILCWAPMSPPRSSTSPPLAAAGVLCLWAGWRLSSSSSYSMYWPGFSRPLTMARAHSRFCRLDASHCGGCSHWLPEG